MTEPLSRKLGKSISAPAEDLIIRAQVPRDDGQGFMKASFPRANVESIVDLGTGCAGIVLKSGAKLPVMMGFDALEQAVYFADLRRGAVLDLTPVTGEVAARAAFPDLARAFAKEAPPRRNSFDDVPLRIAFFVRQPQEQNFQMCVLDEEDINWKSVTGHSDGRNGPYTKMTLLYGESPFGGREIMVDIPRARFMELYNLAKMNGQEELDLRDETRRRDPDAGKRPEPPKPPPRPPSRVG